jgi:predicted methyltransferase
LFAAMRTKLFALVLVVGPIACDPPPGSAMDGGADAMAATKTADTKTAAAKTSGTPAATDAGAGDAGMSEAEKKAKEAKELIEDNKAMEEAAKKETARWDDKLKAEAKALAGANHANAKAAIEAALKGAHRVPGHADRDKYRHPVETLEFFGLKQNMTVVEYGPGEGWFTEILAPVLAKKGKLLLPINDPAGPADKRGTMYGKRIKYFLEKSPDLYGKAETIIIDPSKMELGNEGKADMVLLMRGMHGWQNNGQLDKNLEQTFKVLKPGGIFGIEQHRAKADAKAEESSKKGYLPEAWVIEKVEKAGFKLEGKSEVNANPKDTKDYPDGVWTLPPTYELKDKDREKYAAIGESDRMTLKFVKPKK